MSNGSYCAEHQQLADQRRAEQLKGANKRYNRTRDESDKFYSTAAWRRFRDYILIIRPDCEMCAAEERIPSDDVRVVDHIKPFKERPELGLDEDNVRVLCRQCDNRLRHDRTGRD